MSKKRIVVDYESYYNKKAGISATTQGNANYCASSDAYIVSIVSDDIRWCGEIDEAFERFPEAFWTDPNHQFIAAHAAFDQGWTEKYLGRKLPGWHCVLDKAKFSQLPQNLAAIIRVVFGRKVDKTIRDEMDGVLWEELGPERKQQLIDYCLNDSVEELELWNQLPEMTPVEADIAAHTRMTNARGVAINMDLVRQDMTRLESLKFECFKKIPWRNTDKPLSFQALSKWCAAQGIPVPTSRSKKNDECTDLMSEHPALNEVITNLRLHAKANTLLEKAKSLVQRTTPQDILPLDLLYCGARHTRRWSSRGFNVQNLDREPTVLGDDYDVWTRRWIVPRPGKIFLILDYSQIEPRCLNWLVENNEMLTAMRAGFGIYEAYALAFRGWRGQAGTLKKTDPLLYKSCKDEVLGLGYGMGASKYSKTTGISTAEAEAAVKRFREGNKRITNLWGRFDILIRQACLDKEKTLAIQLPTGDYLKHFYVGSHLKEWVDEEGTTRKKQSYKSYTIKGDFGKDSIQPSLWGGVLTENVTQRMARDVMVEAVLRLENAGLPVLFTSHDEVILEVDQDNQADAKATAVHLMKTAPAWASDLPLEVDGDFAAHYVK
jgi:DNA polymerase